MRKLILAIFAIPVLFLSVSFYLIFLSSTPAALIISAMNKDPLMGIEIKYEDIRGNISSGFTLKNFVIEDKQSQSPVYSINNFSLRYDNILFSKYNLNNLTQGKFSVNEIIAEGGVIDLDLLDEMNKRRQNKNKKSPKNQVDSSKDEGTKQANSNNENENEEVKLGYYNLMIVKVNFKDLKFISKGKEIFMPEVSLDNFKISTDEIYLQNLKVDHKYGSFTSKLTDPKNYTYDISVTIKSNPDILTKENLKINSILNLGKDIPFKIDLYTENKEFRIQYDRKDTPEDILLELNNFTTDKWLIKTTYISVDKFLGKIQIDPNLFDFNTAKDKVALMQAGASTILHPQELELTIMGRQFYLPEESRQPLPLMQAGLLQSMLKEVNVRAPASEAMQAQLDQSNLQDEPSSERQVENQNMNN